MGDSEVKSIIFFDVATKTGWAALLTDEVASKVKHAKTGNFKIASGVKETKAKRGESPSMRFRHFYKWARDLMELIEPDMIGYEQAHFRGGAATELLLGFTTRLTEIAATLGIDCASLHSSTIKKFATDDGKAKKGAVVEAMKNMYPEITIIDDNHADALAGLGKLITDHTKFKIKKGSA